MFQIGIDVGGTFTDFVALHPDAEPVLGKTPSVPGDESSAVLESIRKIAMSVGIAPSELLEQTEVINFGTTVVTNAMLEHRGAAAGMLTTLGFRDIVDLRRGFKESLADIRLQPPEPVIRRQDRIGISERIDADGNVVVPLDEEGVRAAVQELGSRGIASFAICFLQSPISPVHERRAAEIVRELMPDAFVTLSSEVLNRRGEFERFSATMLNAFLSPVLGGYLTALQSRLKDSGFGGQLLVMQSNGGSVSAEVCEDYGVGALLSGPAGGVVGASHVGTVAGFRDVIGVDMGGTSYDVSLVRNSRPQVRTDAWLARYRVGLPILDVHTIGAGGGSISWIDQGGALRVGPRSAGARPGPACYGVGGTLPTVTDANLLLGYLNPAGSLGGEIRLNRDLAEEAITREIAGPMSLTTIEAALGVFLITNNNLSNGIRYVSVQRGRDPRDFALVAFGGAAATHASVQARDLGIKSVLVPKTAGVLSAFGNLIADRKVSLMAPVYSRIEDLDLNWLEDTLDLQYQSHRKSVSGTDVDRLERRVWLDLRYEGQVNELSVPVERREGGIDVATLAVARDDFEQMHQDMYTFRLPGREVEVMAVRQDLVGVRRVHSGLKQHAPASGAPTAVARREIVIPRGAGDHDTVEAPVYSGEAVWPGHRFTGPAVVEEANTTILLLRGDVAEVDLHGTYIISIDCEKD